MAAAPRCRPEIKNTFPSSGLGFLEFHAGELVALREPERGPAFCPSPFPLPAEGRGPRSKVRASRAQTPAALTSSPLGTHYARLPARNHVDRAQGPRGALTGHPRAQRPPPLQPGSRGGSAEACSPPTPAAGGLIRRQRPAPGLPGAGLAALIPLSVTPRNPCPPPGLCERLSIATSGDPGPVSDGAVASPGLVSTRKMKPEGHSRTPDSGQTWTERPSPQSGTQPGCQGQGGQAPFSEAEVVTEVLGSQASPHALGQQRTGLATAGPARGNSPSGTPAPRSPLPSRGDPGLNQPPVAGEGGTRVQACMCPSSGCRCARSHTCAR